MNPRDVRPGEGVPGPLISFERVSRAYRAGATVVPAVSDVSLVVRAGETVAIVGRSGSGKSSLMNIMGLLDRPDSGRYLLAGTDVSRLGCASRARLRNRLVGFVFQSFALLHQATALENVELPLLYRSPRLAPRVRRGLALDTLEAVGLSHRKNHLPGQMSGGEQQRVGIARALVNRPPLLLADEPTGNLDTRSGREIMDLFGRLQDEGLTIVLVTHEPRLAAACERRIRLRDGRLVSGKRTEPASRPRLTLLRHRASAGSGGATP